MGWAGWSGQRLPPLRTAAELALLNDIYALLRLQSNFFAPQQKLLAKHRLGAKVTKRYDTAATPYQIRRDLLDLQDQLLALVKAKHAPRKAAGQAAFFYAGILT